MGCALLDTGEGRLCARHPPARDGHVDVDGPVQERQPARTIRRLYAPPLAQVGSERPLGQLDGPRILTLKMERLAETVEDVGVLSDRERLLEASACAIPLGARQRRPPFLHQLRDTHRTSASHKPDRAVRPLGSGWTASRKFEPREARRIADSLAKGGPPAC